MFLLSLCRHPHSIQEYQTVTCLLNLFAGCKASQVLQFYHLGIPYPLLTTFQGEYSKFAFLCQKDCQRKVIFLKGTTLSLIAFALSCIALGISVARALGMV